MYPFGLYFIYFHFEVIQSLMRKADFDCAKADIVHKNKPAIIKTIL
jgi:hypothetical protein